MNKKPKLFKAKLLKNLNYISGCKLMAGDTVKIEKINYGIPDTFFVIWNKSRIKIFKHEFEEM